MTGKSVLTINAYSDAKALPIDFLQNLGVKEAGGNLEIPYFDQAKKSFRSRLRDANGKRWWSKGEGTLPYGLWLLEPGTYCILPEGESDAQTFWLHGYRALGIPGATLFKSEWTAYVKDYPTLYICRDNDAKGGGIFVEKTIHALREGGYAGRVAVVRAPYACKDFNDLNCIDPDKFKAAFKKIEAAALEEAFEIGPESHPANTIDELLKELEKQPDGQKAASIKEHIFPALVELSPLEQETTLKQIKQASGFQISALRQELKLFSESRFGMSGTSVSSDTSVSSVRAALFDGLIEIVKAADKLMFWTADGLEDNHLDGDRVLVPPMGPTLFQTPTDRALELVDRYEDSKLFNELVEFFKAHIDLADDRAYKVLAAYALHTWLIEQADDSPIIHAYGPKGSGKTTLVETVGAVARRSIPTLTLTGPALFRVNALFAPTLLIDEISLANSPDVRDILNARFSRGIKVIRVNMDKSGLDQIESFEVFGTTVLAGTQDVSDTIRSRSIRFYMERACRKVRRTLDKQTAAELIDTLAAFRARHLETELETPEPIVRDGRLNDVVYPLHQIILLVSPGDAAEFEDFCKELERDRAEEDALSTDAVIVQAMRACAAKVDNNKISVRIISDYVNNGRSESEQLKERSVGKVMSRLGFKTTRTNSGHGARYWDESRLKRLEQRYDLQSDDTDVSDDTDDTEGRKEPLEKNNAPKQGELVEI